MPFTMLRRLVRTSGPIPAPSRRMLVFDGLIALLLTVYAILAVHGQGGTSISVVQPFRLGLYPVVVNDISVPQPVPADYLAAAATTLPVTLRRRYPLAVFWYVIVMSAARPEFGDTMPKLVACTIAAYSAAAYSPYRPVTLVSLGAAVAAIAGIYQHALPEIPKTLGLFLFFVPIMAVGVSLRNLRERITAAQERALALEREKEQATALATELERARIARELHDVITHNVSVMVVQAGAARKIMSRSPEQATSALLVVESAGRAAMTELQHTIGLLAPDGEAQLAPQPGLAELDQLIGRVQATGMRVALTRTGTPQPLAAGSDLAAYRVVQEALTNAAKHAPGATARVRIAYGGGELVVEVVNGVGSRMGGGGGGSGVAGNGRGGGNGNGGGSGSGRGLVGLRERLAACGGRFDAAARPGGGFAVRAVIPLHDLTVGMDEAA